MIHSLKEVPLPDSLFQADVNIKDSIGEEHVKCLEER